MVMTVVMESCPVAKHDYSGCCESIVLMMMFGQQT